MPNLRISPFKHFNLYCIEFTDHILKYTNIVEMYNMNKKIHSSTYNLALEYARTVVQKYTFGNQSNILFLRNNIHFIAFTCLSIAIKTNELAYVFDTYNLVNDYACTFKSCNLLKMEIAILKIIDYKCNLYTICTHAYQLFNKIPTRNTLTRLYKAPHLLSKHTPYEIAVALRFAEISSGLSAFIFINRYKISKIISKLKSKHIISISLPQINHS